MRRIGYTLSLLSFVTSLIAQEGVIDPRSYGPGTSYVVKSWTTTNGLAQNSILAFTQGSDNRIWLSTVDNVASFDGYHFSNYKAMPSEQPSVRISSIYESHSKQLWFLSQGQRLFTLEKNTLVRFATDKKISVFRDNKAGEQFFGTIDGELYQTTAGAPKRIASFGKTAVIDLLPAKDGLYAIAGQTLYRYRHGIVGQMLSDPHLRCIRSNKAGDIFVAADNRLYIKRAGSDVFAMLPLPFPCRVSDLSVSGQRHCIVGTDQGLVIIDEQGSSRRITTADGLSSNNVSTVHESKDGTIWVGTEDHGINLLMPKLVSLLHPPEQQSSQGCGPILELDNKELLVSYYCDGVSRLSGQNEFPFFPKDTGCVWSMAKDNAGGVWLGTYNQGLFHLSGKNWKQYFDPLGDKSNICFASLTDRSNTTWFGTMDGIYFFDDGKIKRLTSDSSHATVIHFCEDGEGRIWACRRNRIDVIENETCTAMYVPGLTKDDFVVHLYAGKDGVLWGITYSGNLLRYKEERFFLYNTAGTLIKGKGCNVTEDEYGRLWIGSFEGLYVAGMKSLNDFADGKTRVIDLTHVGKESGMQNLECNTGFQPSVCKRASGPICFSTIDGMAVVNPSRYQMPDSDYSLSFGAFHANGVAYPADTIIRLPGYDYKRIECQLSAICFWQKENLKVQYRLDKHDSVWSRPTTDLKIVYNHLGPGTYKLRVRVYGHINEIHLWIHVPLPFWKTAWFLISATTLIPALALLIVLIRLRKQRERERLKNEIGKQYAELELKSLKAQMNPHFIFNCLNSIKYFIETDSQMANNYLHKFSSLIRCFLEQSDSNDTSLTKEIRLLTLYMEMEQLRSDHGFDFSFHVSANIDQSYTIIPAMLIQPFIENAIHHGIRHLDKRGLITVSFERLDAELKVTIEDNGIGRKRSAEINRRALQGHQSMGSRFTEDRIRVINTMRNTSIQLAYIDTPDAADGSSGLKVILTFPFKSIDL